MGHSGLLAASHTGSILLSGISRDDFARIEPHLEPVTLHTKDVLTEYDTPFDYVYFPESGMVSLIALFTRDKPVEMASVGREGMVGMALFFGAGHLPEKAIVQVPGRATRMRADAFHSALRDCDTLRTSLQAYAACLYSFAAQNAACGLKHATTPRLARWLLHAADQSGTTHLQLTHGFAAIMLGVRRSSVTVSAGALRARKLIEYSRSTINISDRDGLEQAACECYETIRSTYERLIVR
jgi:CRP-like cAMP-binding protein